MAKQYLSPNELINVSRLKKAAELSAGYDYKIYELADDGFWFSNIFREEFHKAVWDLTDGVCGVEEGGEEEVICYFM